MFIADGEMGPSAVPLLARSLTPKCVILKIIRQKIRLFNMVGQSLVMQFQTKKTGKGNAIV